MIDKERRRLLALYLRHLSVGLISNDEFENNVMDEVSDGWLPEQYYKSKKVESDDKIIQPMLELCWGLYDDTRNHKLKVRDTLSPEASKVIARCIMFLHSDKEYQWPYFDTSSPLTKFSLAELLLAALSFGQYFRDKRKEQELAFKEFQKLGDYDIWPFITKEDYLDQLSHQPFLTQS